MKEVNKLSLLIAGLSFVSLAAQASFDAPVARSISEGLTAISDRGAQVTPEAAARMLEDIRVPAVSAQTAPIAEQDKLKSMPSNLKPFTRVLTLKNMLAPKPGGGQGGVVYEPIQIVVVAVHPNMVVSLPTEKLYADDAFDAGGHAYYLHFVYTGDRLKTMVTLAPGLKPAPLGLLDGATRGIVRDALLDLGRASCGMSIPDSISTEELIHRIDSACAAKHVNRLNTKHHP
jgi:hypothetical protein